MAVKIANACADERGKYSGGAAGSQNGLELKIQNWYSYPWNTVIRAKDSALAERIAQAAELACANKHIGYDQGQRVTLFDAVAKIGWKPESLKAVTTDCETDCSALVAVCVNAALGSATVSKNIYTGNEAAALMNTGRFAAYTSSDYTGSSSKLQRGDILINTVHHTAIVTTGAVKTAAAATTVTSATSVSLASGYQIYHNGSTIEPVYQTSELKGGSIGSLDKYEDCYCFGRVNGAYLVAYRVTGGYKTGYVAYNGGTTF